MGCLSILIIYSFIFPVDESQISIGNTQDVLHAFYVSETSHECQFGSSLSLSLSLSLCLTLSASLSVSERDAERVRQRETQRERETDRQTERERERERERLSPSPSHDQNCMSLPTSQAKLTRRKQVCIDYVWNCFNSMRHY